MVHLMSRGHVIQTVKYINKCWKEQDTDISLIRHFVIEVLDMIGPPYSIEFINLFLPLTNNENINSSLKVEEEKSINEFISYCKDIPLSVDVDATSQVIEIEENNFDEEKITDVIEKSDDIDDDDIYQNDE
jgi:hypothetical protein